MEVNFSGYLWTWPVCSYHRLVRSLLSYATIDSFRVCEMCPLILLSLWRMRAVAIFFPWSLRRCVCVDSSDGGKDSSFLIVGFAFISSCSVPCHSFGFLVSLLNYFCFWPYRFSQYVSASLATFRLLTVIAFFRTLPWACIPCSSRRLSSRRVAIDSCLGSISNWTSTIDSRSLICYRVKF